MIALLAVFAAPLLLLMAAGAVYLTLVVSLALAPTVALLALGSWLADTMNPDGPDDASEDGSDSVIARW